MRAGGKVYLTGKAQRLDGIGQPEAAVSHSSSRQGLFYLRVPTQPCGWFAGTRGESGHELVVWRLLLGGSQPSSPSLVYRAGPIASPLEPLLLALQPAGPLEEGLSLFFNKLLTVHPPNSHCASLGFQD